MPNTPTVHVTAKASADAPRRQRQVRLITLREKGSDRDSAETSEFVDLIADLINATAR